MKEYKVGGTFTFGGALPAKFVDGFFSGWEVASQIRDDKDNLVHDLVATWADPVTARTVLLSSGLTPTDDWPLGVLNLDIKFTNPTTGFVWPTKTLQFKAVKRITQ